jgi:altronate hydrolase
MFGSRPAPTIKLASNTPMFERLREDMDINCGAVLDEDLSLPEMGRRIFEALLRHASGEPTRSELLGLGDQFIPWHLGSSADWTRQSAATRFRSRGSG